MDDSISHITLRLVTLEDLPILFEQQRDPEAAFMAAFTSRDPNDRDAFMVHWDKIMNDETVTLRVVDCDGAVAGSIVCFLMEGQPNIGYWIGKAFWGRGIATQSLRLFIDELGIRPLYAAVAVDNVSSIRVLEKCGFEKHGTGRYFANARGEEIDEIYYILR